MDALTKDLPNRYVTNDGKPYWGLPRQLPLVSSHPRIQGIVRAEYDIGSNDEPWLEYGPASDFFGSGGGRAPIAFTRLEPLAHKIWGEAKASKGYTFGSIGPEGIGPLDQTVFYHITRCDDLGLAVPHGYVWRNDREVLVQIYLTSDRVEELAAELIARPGAHLQLYLSFAYYQDDAYREELDGPVLIERKGQVPIVDVDLSVVTPLPEIVLVQPDTKEPLPVPPPAVVQSPDFSGVTVRLNWVLGLLVLLLVVLLFK